MRRMLPLPPLPFFASCRLRCCYRRWRCWPLRPPRCRQPRRFRDAASRLPLPPADGAAFRLLPKMPAPPAAAAAVMASQFLSDAAAASAMHPRLMLLCRATQRASPRRLIRCRRRRRHCQVLFSPPTLRHIAAVRLLIYAATPLPSPSLRFSVFAAGISAICRAIRRAALLTFSAAEYVSLIRFSAVSPPCAAVATISRRFTEEAARGAYSQYFRRRSHGWPGH